MLGHAVRPVYGRRSFAVWLATRVRTRRCLDECFAIVTDDFPLAGETAAWVADVVARIRPGSPSGQRLVRLGVDRSAGTQEGALVIGRGSVVVKLHARRTDSVGLRARLAAVHSPDLTRLWVQPLSVAIAAAPNGRVATVWPRVEPLQPNDPVPWAQLGGLLAALHSVPISSGGPAQAGAARLRRAVAGVQELGRSDLAWLAEFGEQLVERLPRRGQVTTWVHGDFHLGQVARRHGDAGWLLLDIDDMGLGDPAWDLGRPAGFWAAGLLDDSAWSAFLAAYRAAGGRGVPSSGDPWPVLDLSAQAAVFIAASRALRRTPRSSTARSLLAVCLRMRECVT